MTPLLLAAALLFLALSAADILLTLKNLKRGAVEKNPLLGKHPKPSKVIAFGVATTVLWLGAAMFFVLKGVQGAWAVFGLGIFLRVWVVSKNYKLSKELKA
jgi:hypothetical protein